MSLKDTNGTTLSPFRMVDTGPEELLSLFGATMPSQELGERAVFVPDDGKDADCSPLGSQATRRSQW
jgi:hypothetical protein